MDSSDLFLTEVQNALRRGEFTLYYQPKLDLKSMKVCGAEALLRWHHPSLGTLLPASFITLAEQTGAIVPIGQWVLRTACAQAKIWQEHGEQIQVAVNLSVCQILDSEFLPSVARILNETGVSASALEFEMTESAVMHNEPLCIQIINHLRELGFKLSLDDFGVAYSSLKYLKLFESDALKLDRTFVQSIPSQTRDFVIVQAVIELAHHLGMKVVAEGVETLSQLSTLAHWGCDMAQGYLISPPLSHVEFEQRFLQTLSWNVAQ